MTLRFDLTGYYDACALHTPQIHTQAATPTQTNDRAIHPQLPPNQSDQPKKSLQAAAHLPPRTMATQFCAAVCRLAFPASAPAPGLGRGRARRGVVVVRAEADTAGGSGINPAIRKEEAKVVDTVLAGELSKPLTPYCRCWRSGTFPLCDGSHVKHNKATGDNVGPLLVKK
uniref:Uncharacterized protein n=1 Tax=Avena sativa TaxID=4498 RepID=A0ACD5UN35_AVESA